jgi:hypothetical protein
MVEARTAYGSEDRTSRNTVLVDAPTTDIAEQIGAMYFGRVDDGAPVPAPDTVLRHKERKPYDRPSLAGRGQGHYCKPEDFGFADAFVSHT